MTAVVLIFNVSLGIGLNETHTAPSDAYDAALAKGKCLLSFFTSVATSAPSKFQDWGQLQQYGWTVKQSYPEDPPSDVGSMLDALGLSKNKNLNYWLNIQQSEDFTNRDGVKGVSVLH